MAQEHFVVAGANGFLGRNLVQTLSRLSNIEITALIRPGRTLEELPDADLVTCMEVDITDQKAVLSCFLERSPTHVVNASSYGVRPNEKDFAQSVSVNVLGTYALLAASARAHVQRFIQIGSFFEYGNQTGVLHEDTPLRPESVYAATKAASGLLLRDRRLADQVETAIARVFHIWGPHELPYRLSRQVIQACQKNTQLELTSGLQEKNFTYVKDAARWITSLALFDKPLPHDVFNIAGDMRCSVKTFATEIASRLDGEDFLRFGAKATPSYEPDSGAADTARLARAIGPLNPTPFDQALNETLKF